LFVPHLKQYRRTNASRRISNASHRILGEQSPQASPQKLLDFEDDEEDHTEHNDADAVAERHGARCEQRLHEWRKSEGELRRRET
jgi:hypothetical protein